MIITYQELKQLVQKADVKKKVPTPKALRISDAKIVVKERIGADVILTVYDNGYVLYQMRNHSTVFPLHLCEEYEYVFQEDIPYIIDLSFFEEQPWYMRLVLEGEDRLEYNQDSKAESWNVSYSAYAEDWSAICEEDPYIEKLIEMEAERERLEALLSILTENQAMVMRQKYLYDETQKEIAEKLGITPQAVSDIVRKAMRRLEKNLTT